MPSSIPPFILLTGDVTPEQILDAYRRGQRTFLSIDVSAEPGFPRLANADLRGTEFLESSFHSITFFQCDLTGVTFRRCNLKCTTFEACALQGSVWEDCSVCAIAFVRSNTPELSAGELHAYGALLADASVFIEYAVANGRRIG